MKSNLFEYIKENTKVITSTQNHEKIIKKIIILMTKKLLNGGKILLCGNGGSAADAQHLAAEFLVRLNPKKKRKSIPALSLATDISTITACGNDYDFSRIFERTFEGLYKKNDLLFVLSTSGKSKNIINVLKSAKKNKIKSIGFLGSNGGLAKKYCDYKIVIKSSNVARIQESHIFLGHYIFDQVEKNLFG